MKDHVNATASPEPLGTINGCDRNDAHNPEQPKPTEDESVD